MRLAHCSDLHLLSHDGARWLDLANKRWIGAMNLLSNRSRHYHVDAFDDMVSDLNTIGVDHVLCTGDVTNLALRQEFAFAREKFNWFLNGLVPVIGIGIDAYLIYKSFFVSLWDAGFKTGRSVVLFSLALVAVSILYVLYLKITNPQRLTGSSIDHITTEPEPGIHA